MKEKKGLKRLIAVFAAVTLLLASTMPAFAATKTYTRGITVKRINAGSCYHIVNTNISGNQILEYTYRIVPQTKDTRYDIVFSYDGSALASANCREDSGNIKSSTYLKTTSSSNTGIVACIYVKSGWIKMNVRYKSKNPSKSAVLTFKKQSSSHRTLKSVTVKKGRTLSLQRRRGNVTRTPVIFAGKKNVSVRRTLNSKSYETYSFAASSLAFRSYTNNVVTRSRTIQYDSANGTMKYVMLLLPGKVSGAITTIKGSSSAILYPSDCMSIKAVLK